MTCVVCIILRVFVLFVMCVFGDSKRHFSGYGGLMRQDLSTFILVKTVPNGCMRCCNDVL